MKLIRVIVRGVVVLFVLLVAACQGDVQTPVVVDTPTRGTSVVELYTPVPTLVPFASSTPTILPTLTFTPTHTLTSTVTPSSMPSPTDTLSPTETLAPTVTPTLEMVDHYLLDRPIFRDEENGKVDWIDRTYPYGGTQLNIREVHHGVEFVNARFTPVLAAADGDVYYAGDDVSILFGPYNAYYGNLVVIRHPFTSPKGLTVFTLYAHLQDVEVETGQMVQTGEHLGRVGDSGIAIGPHLHFEVRVGDPHDYGATRNPELWLRPYPQFGTLAGWVTNAHSLPVYGVTLLVRSSDVRRETYTYGDRSVNSDAIWRENFTLGDLPAGRYEVIVHDGNSRVRFRQNITIQSGQTTWIPIELN